MPEANFITEHMEVLGSDGAHVGTVDSVDGSRIKLTKSDSGDGHHHYVDTAHVQDIKGHTVTLTTTAADALASVRPEVDPQIGVATGAG